MFQDLEHHTDDDIEAALSRNDPAELALLSITVALSCRDAASAEKLCIRLAASDDPGVRANALVSLGHLARRFRVLDERAVRPLIQAGLADAHELVRLHAKSAADEIHQFLGWNFKGHTYASW